MASRSVPPFLHITAEFRYTSQRAVPSPVKITPSHGGSGPHLTHDCLGPSELTAQTASRSVLPFLQGSLV